MRNRDRRIIDDLERFRVMSRDQIAAIHFSGLKAPATAANFVLKRLRDRGYIDAITTAQPYLYKPKGSRLKADSQKIPHFLAVVDVYIQLARNGVILRFDVEPKYAKGEIEPDIFAVWEGASFFIEIQRSASYSKREFDAKLKRYERFKREGKHRGTFPYIVVVSKRRYNISGFSGLPVVQVREIGELVARVKRKVSG